MESHLAKLPFISKCYLWHALRNNIYTLYSAHESLKIISDKIKENTELY